MTQQRAGPAQNQHDATEPSPYSEIDGSIESWVGRNGLTLWREWQGEARFWYTSRGAECFQVSVNHPADGLVTVHATSIETDDDAELSGEWNVELNELERALAAATNLIDLWASRARTSPRSSRKPTGPDGGTCAG